jgi:putative tryptophan/tyrosine transport system substrate-binding protein
MRRRDFISLIGGATAAWPLPALAQQTRLPIIGFVGADATSWSPWTTAFVQRLHELGWTEGHTVAIEYRWNEGKPERIAEIAAEFIRLRVDVIVTNAIAAPALKQATTVIPIVFAIAPDPVRGGLVANLARPGGNVTGQSLQSIDVAGKRLALLRDIVPQLRRLAIGFNAGFSETVAEADVVKATAHTLGLEVVPLEIRRTEDVAPAFETLKSQIDAIYVVGDALVSASRSRIIIFALSRRLPTRRLPTIFNTRDYVQAGALMSYGPNFPALFRRTAEYVDKILRGTKPGDLPVEQPTKFDLVINLTAARALGLTIPPTLLAIADEVIE